LNDDLMKALTEMYPGARSIRLIASGEPGCGKSTLLASVPVAEGKQRYALDFEDSMAYLDAGAEGIDVYTPRRQAFKMKRYVFPSIENLGKVVAAVNEGKGSIGALIIDNIAILQDEIVNYLAASGGDHKKLQATFASFGVLSALPNPGLTKTWTYNHDGTFWSACKAIAKGTILSCSKAGIHFIASTEEGNVWVNYGKPDAKITGKKAKIWDAWYRYTDLVVSLKRDANKTEPPTGSLYIDQPKMRLQGFNPKFRMDWAGFVAEMQAAKGRTDADIPKEVQVEIPQESFSEAG
jgi:hypothetical protein